MKMKNGFKMLALILSIGMIIILGSCENVDEPSMANVSIEMKATSSLSTINFAGRKMNSDLTFNEIIVGITELEFETIEEAEIEDDDHSDGSSDDDSDDDTEAEEYEIEYEGNFVVDLIAGTSNPDFGIADLIPGLYKEIEIEMEPILEGGKTIFIAFEYRTDPEMDPILIEYSNSYELEIEIEKETGYLIESGNLNQILILLDLDMLFAGIDFSAALPDEDGVVRINESSNADLESSIRLKLNDVMEAGEDDDDDDKFDDEEDDDDESDDD